jgi:hypothetical protein
MIAHFSGGSSALSFASTICLISTFKRSDRRPDGFGWQVRATRFDDLLAASRLVCDPVSILRDGFDQP